MAVDMHAHAMRLHDGRLAIDVDDQSGQVVTLTMYQTIGVSLTGIGQSDGLTNGQGRRKAPFPEIIVNRFVIKSEHPHSNASHLPMSFTQETSLAVHHLH